ncbi:MAG TPA: glycosyltransferase [Myxococcota bacterium]|nr:glycosyltransferase [Myxococcota bacterium]
MGADTRVLLVGSAPFDSVIDSYRRALSPHYQVQHFDPFSVLGGLENRLGPSRALRLNVRIGYLVNMFVREPLALVEPRLLRVAREFAPDIVLVTCIESLRPKVVAGLRGGNMRCKVIGVFSDAMVNFGRSYFFGADYHALFFKDHYIVDRFRAKLGWRHVHYLPQACDRVLHRKLPLSDADRATYGCDITVAGNLYPWRAAMLGPLVGRDVKIWGPPPSSWLEYPIAARHTGRYVAGDEKCKAMLASRIVLNQNHYAEVAGTNKRTFEVAAIGAFQLTDTPALSDVFDPETEVSSFGTQKEMIEKIDYFLARPELCAEMAERARVRAHAQHTYEHRWVAHLETVGLRPPTEFPVQPESLVVRAV